MIQNISKGTRQITSSKLPHTKSTSEVSNYLTLLDSDTIRGESKLSDRAQSRDLRKSKATAKVLVESTMRVRQEVVDAEG